MTDPSAPAPQREPKREPRGRFSPGSATVILGQAHTDAYDTAHPSVPASGAWGCAPQTRVRGLHPFGLPPPAALAPSLRALSACPKWISLTMTNCQCRCLKHVMDIGRIGRFICLALLSAACCLAAPAEDFTNAIHAFLQHHGEVEKRDGGIVVGILDKRVVPTQTSK